MYKYLMQSIITFLVLTIVYYFLRFKATEPKMEVLWSIVYIIVLLIAMFFINLEMTKRMCGKPQLGTSFIVTFTTWMFIFIILLALIRLFPGWLSPFSNTFGYLFAKAGGLNKLMNKIMAPIDEGPKGDKAAARALQQIYGDNALVINQLTEENFQTFWEKMTNAGLFTSDAPNYRTNLFNLIKLKNLVGETLWAIFGGILAIFISDSFIANSTCKHSSKEMMQRHNQYEAKELEEAQASDFQRTEYESN